MDYLQTEVVVVGAGPGGYAAAFYAADKGKKVVLVEKDERLGGVCLQRGCIPSKALLHASLLVKEARHSHRMGIAFGTPQIDFETLRSWKNGIIHKLADGVRGLAKRREVQVLKGRGIFEDARTLRVETESGQQFIKFQNAIAKTDIELFFLHMD